MTVPTRRAFLVASGGASAAALGWWLIDSEQNVTDRPESDAGNPRAESASDYVDHDGWMLSVEDKEKIVASPGEPREFAD